MWLGAKSTSMKNRTFVWVKSQSQMIFTNWDPVGPQPDNNNNEEGCVHVRVFVLSLTNGSTINDVTHILIFFIVTIKNELKSYEEKAD